MKRRTTSSEQAPDLFGIKSRQGDLFANEPPRNNGVGVADPCAIRARLYKMLAEGQGGRVIPAME
jgi:hypothetical protein